MTSELSKVETPAIRERMMAHLLNIDEGLAIAVADNLGVTDMPPPGPMALPRKDLEPSPALSIMENGPDNFAGRKVGVLISQGVDAQLMQALQAAVDGEGAVMEVIAPRLGKLEAADGTPVPAKHFLDGGPSVLFDAVALLMNEESAERLADEAAARDFVADAFAHCKFIGFTSGAVPLVAKTGVKPGVDEALCPSKMPPAPTVFVEACRKLRLWARQIAVKH